MIKCKVDIRICNDGVKKNNVGVKKNIFFTVPHHEEKTWGKKTHLNSYDKKTIRRNVSLYFILP